MTPRMWKPLALSLAIVLGVAAAAHLAFSVGAAYVMANYGPRAVDISVFPRRILDAPDLIGGYAQANVTPGMTIVAGSSFSFGYPFPATLSFPYALSPDVKNLSAVGAGLSLIVRAQLCEMKARKIHAKAIIVEVPLVNETYEITHYSHKPPNCSDEPRRSLFGYAVRQFIGLKWFKLLDDPYSDTADSKKINIEKVKSDYFVSQQEFDDARPLLTQHMQIAFELTRELADEAYLFVTPVYIDGVAQAGDDPARVLEQYEFAQQECRAIAGDHCIDTSDMLHRIEFYMNLTHINGTGAAYLGKVFRDELGKAHN